MNRAYKSCIKLPVFLVYRCRIACLKRVAMNPSLELHFVKVISIYKQIYELFVKYIYVQPRMEALIHAGWYECGISPCRGCQELPIEPGNTPRGWEMREIWPLQEFEFLLHAWVCVLPKIREERGDRERKSPKRVGDGPKCGAKATSWRRISFWALGWAFQHLPLILALDPHMWPIFPLSLALVPAFWVTITPFWGHFLPVLSFETCYRLMVRFPRHLCKMIQPRTFPIGLRYIITI